MRPVYVDFGLGIIISVRDVDNKSGLTIVICLFAGFPGNQELANIGQPLRNEALRLLLKEVVEILVHQHLSLAAVLGREPDTTQSCPDRSC